MHDQGPAHTGLTAVVVAGGQSTRLGQDKRRLRLWGADGPTLLEHTVALMADICDETVVVLNDPMNWPGLPARLVSDVYPSGAALGGIYAGLIAATNSYIFAVAADMPLLQPDLIRWMVRQPRDYDVLLPRVGSTRARNRLSVESLHAIYSRACAEPMRRQLEAGNPQVIGFFPEVRVRIIEPESVHPFDPEGIAFNNVNTPADLEAVRRLLGMSSQSDAPSTSEPADQRFNTKDE